MNVFQRFGPGKVAGLDAAADGFQPTLDGVAFGAGEDPGSREHLGVGDGAADVFAEEAAVETHRGGEAGDKGVRGLAEAAAPSLIDGFFAVHPEVLARNQCATLLGRSVSAYYSRQ